MSFDGALFDDEFDRDWHMLPGERAALIYVLQRFQPKFALEIGTFRAGSLRPISAVSQHVFTFDIDPNQHRIASQFPNVTFVTGDTGATLSPVIDRLNQNNEELNFILIDGSHEEMGVYQDVVNCLRYIPKRGPCAILMHDSSNPAVRRGLARVSWSDYPHVHSVDLDFVHGALYDRSDISGQIWGGLGLAILRPDRRFSPLRINALFSYSLTAMISKSVYARKTSIV